MLRKIRKFNIYKKIVLSFLTISTISVCFISSALYIVFSRNARQEIYTYSMQNLAKVNYSVSDLYKNLFPVINYILTSEYTDTILGNSQINRVTESYAMQKLKLLHSSNTKMKKIGLVNIESDRYLGTRGVYFGVEDEIKNVLTAEKVKNMTIITRNVLENENLETSSLMDVVTFIYYPKARYPKGLIVIDIKDSDFRKFFVNDDASRLQEKIFIIDENKNIIVNSDLENESNYDSILFSDEILSSTEEKGYFIEEIEGSRQAVAFIKTDVPGWTVVSISSYEDMMPVIRELPTIIAGIVILMILVNIIVSYYLIQGMYNPLNTLLKKINSGNIFETKDRVNEIEVISDVFKEYEQQNIFLEEYRRKSVEVLRENWLRSILKAEVNIISEQSSMPNYCNYELSSRYLRVLIIVFDHYNEYIKKHNEIEQNHVEVSMANILSELIGKHCVNELLKIENNCYVIILRQSSLKLDEEIILGIGELQYNLLKHMDITITACYGKCVNSWINIKDSYQSAKKGLKKKLCLGLSSIINAEHDCNRLLNTEYPVKVEKMAFEAIMTGSVNESTKNIDCFVHILNDYESEDCIHYAIKFCYEMIQNCSEKNSVLRYRTLQEIENIISGMETLDEIGEMLNKLSLQIIEERKVINQLTSSTTAILQAQKYIEENYNDDTLSVEKLADIICLSPPYFGKLFFATFHQSCNDYIMEVRLKKAINLLENTDAIVGDISEKVGISSVNYFYILFKKRYGLTPTQYRKQHRSE